jgi:uncharacterized membrane protein
LHHAAGAPAILIVAAFACCAADEPQAVHDSRRGAWWLAGLALFAVSLGKLFLYDLPSLSSITRALSFHAVGAVLLLGGFFYQRLTAADDVGATS